MKRRGVGDPVGFGFRRKPLHDGHAGDIDDADLVLAPVRGVDLLALGDVRDAFDAGHVGHGLDHRVRPKVDHVQESRAQMGRQEVVIVVIDG